MEAILSAKSEPWHVTIEVRAGVLVPTLGPMEAREAPSSLGMAVGRTPWPGVFVWVWRALFGGVDSSLDTRVLRAQFRAVTERRWHHLARELTGGELLVFSSRYMAAQVAWVGRITAHAEREIAERCGDVPPARAGDRVGPGARLVMPNGTRVGAGAGRTRARVAWSAEEMVSRYGDGRQRVPPASGGTN